MGCTSAPDVRRKMTFPPPSSWGSSRFPTFFALCSVSFNSLNVSASFCAFLRTESIVAAEWAREASVLVNGHRIARILWKPFQNSPCRFPPTPTRLDLWTSLSHCCTSATEVMSASTLLFSKSLSETINHGAPFAGDSNSGEIRLAVALVQCQDGLNHSFIRLSPTPILHHVEPRGCSGVCSREVAPAPILPWHSWRDQLQSIAWEAKLEEKQGLRSAIAALPPKC